MGRIISNTLYIISLDTNQLSTHWWKEPRNDQHKKDIYKNKVT